MDKQQEARFKENAEAEAQRAADAKERRYQLAKARFKNEEAAKRPAPVLVFDGEENLKPPKWLIEKIIPAEGAGMLFGETDVGKTFAALSMAIPIGANTPWQGHAVEHGTVLFIEAEGTGSFPWRKHAAKAEAGLGDARHLTDAPFPFATIFESLGFGPDSDLALVQMRATAIKEGVAGRGLPPIRFVVVDTFAQNMQGDADSNHDTTAFLHAFRAFLKALSIEPVFGLLIHHPGHANKDRARGAYALPADLDLIMQLEGERDALTLSCTRMRDADRFEPILLALESRPLTMDGRKLADAQGQPLTSLVVVSRTETQEPRREDASLGMRIVRHIEKHPGQTTTQIREDLGVSKNHIVAEVDRLVERGLLKMVPVKHGRAVRQTYEAVPEPDAKEATVDL